MTCIGGLIALTVVYLFGTPTDSIPVLVVERSIGFGVALMGVSCVAYWMRMANGRGPRRGV